MKPGDNILKILKTILVTIALILIASALRVWPLHPLGIRVPWLTYYPAVILSALYGGLFAGLFGTTLASLVILYMWPFLTAVPFINDSADWLGVAVFYITCSMISGISESMHRAQLRAKRAQEQAETANRAKSIFLANMSHELRTPLNAVLGFSRLMRAEPNVPLEQAAKLDIIIRSGEHLLNLINNILDISKIEAGRVLLEESDTDLHQLLQEMQSMMYVKAVEKNLDFKVIHSQDLPGFARVDSIKLRQILINLIGNAIKFTEHGGVILRAGSAETKARQDGTIEDHNRSMIRFEIEDTGSGIQPQDRQRIFESFEQLNNQSASETGTGLGLAISKQYAQLLGGKIGVTDRDIGEHGSVFYLEIPVLKITGKEIRFVHNPGRVIGLAEGQPRHRMVIAEDQPENRLLLHSLLEPLGFELRDAVNGQEAVALFKQWNPDLIWMDIRMPVINGLEATKMIRAAEPASRNTPIIALTAHALEEERREILSAGCTDFIRKPYREGEIFNALEKHLSLRFLYSQEPAILVNKFDKLKVDELQNLPSNLVAELRLSVELLDSERCLNAIKFIAEKDPRLGDHLQNMLEKYQYQELLSILDNLP